eukprot:Nk52_evm3s281 gene=Nk52_evmTU3s281
MPKRVGQSSCPISKEILDNHDCFVFDCDGVLWRGNEIIPGIKNAMDTLRQMGKKLVFVTNNSTKSRSQYARKFEGFDVKVHREEVLGTSFVAAHYLKNVVGLTKRVYLVGESGIEEELELAGINYISSRIEDKDNVTQETFFEIDIEDDVGAVLVGFDLNLNYKKIAKASLYLQNEDCIFVGTNHDTTFPVPGGRIFPGTGGMVAAIAAASHRDPKFLGKPNQTMIDCLLSEAYGIDPSRSVMVGDRLDTDMVFGKAAGMKTLLVMTGVTTEKCVDTKVDDVNEPDYIANSFADLFV